MPPLSPPLEPISKVCIGVLEQSDKPALLSYKSNQFWLCGGQPETVSTAAEVVEAVALQYLLHHQNENPQCYLFELIPSRNFRQIKRLLASTEFSWGEHLVSISSLTEKLKELVAIIHRRYSLFAQVGASDIDQYNQKSKQQESHFFIVITGVPSLVNNSEQSVLWAILLHKGTEVGIVPLLVVSTIEDYNYSQQNNDLHTQALNSIRDALSELCVRIIIIDGNINAQNVSLEEWNLLKQFGLKLELTNRCQEWCDKLVEFSTGKNNTNVIDFLKIRIGLNGASPAYFSMGEKSDIYHALIGGTTRTGKTTLLNNIIINSCEKFDPDALQMTLMDFKDGVSFWEYEGLAHISALYAPVKDEFDNAILCLEQLNSLISIRNKKFREHRVTRLMDYNNVANVPMPRHLLIIDEAQSLFEGRGYQQKLVVKTILSNIAKKGAAAGVHMILCT